MKAIKAWVARDEADCMAYTFFKKMPYMHKEHRVWYSPSGSESRQGNLHLLFGFTPGQCVEVEIREKKRRKA